MNNWTAQKQTNDEANGLPASPRTRRTTWGIKKKNLMIKFDKNRQNRNGIGVRMSLIFKNSGFYCQTL